MFGFYSLPEDRNRISIVGEHKDGILKIAAARCSTKDRFCKKTGREIATKRLKEDNLLLSVNIEKCEGRLFLNMAKVLIEEINRNPKILNKKK